MVVIIARRRNRIILNIDSVTKSLIYLGIPHAVVSLEEIPLLKQLEMMQKATTLIGAHGAGLSWARFTHPRSAIIQLSPYPCYYDINRFSPVMFGFQVRYGIVLSGFSTTSLFQNISQAKVVCAVLKKIHKQPLTSLEKRIEGIFSHDIRKNDVNVDISSLCVAIKRLDPIVNIDDRRTSTTYKMYRPTVYTE